MSLRPRIFASPRFAPRAFVAFVAFVALDPVVAAGVARADGPAAPRESAASSVQLLHLPAVTSVRLDNGLTLVMEENHATPLVSMHLAYGAGWRDDPEGKEGLALLTMRLMTHGTKHVPGNGYESWLDRIGGTDRGWETGADATNEWVTVASDAVPVVLWLWSDQMGFFTPSDDKALEDARALSKNERHQKVDNAPLGAVREMILRALYPKGHPYHEAPPAALDRLTLDDARSFQDRHYTPDRAVLVVSGDFQPAGLLEQVTKYFGPIAPGPVGPLPVTPARLDGVVRLDVAASVPAPIVLMNWRTPAELDADDAELDVAALTMAGSRVGTLQWGLVDGAKVATSVSARQISRALGSDFQIRVAVAPGHTADEVIASIDAMLKTMSRGVFKDEIFRAARENMMLPRLFDLQRPARRAAFEAAFTRARHDPGWLVSDIARYEGMTAADASGALARWLTPSGRVITVVTPDPHASPAGELRAEWRTP